MKIETALLNSITPYARNPRRNAGAVATVKASLQEYGWQQPIVVDKDRVIIVGHTRYLAALELGWTEAPVHIAAQLTPAQTKAYRLMDNKSHERAEWDTDLLALEMVDLQGMEFDLSLTGFDMTELDALAAPDGNATEGDTEPQIDRAEELRVKWGVETGDLWQLGDHRLLCGDSTKAEDVARVMGGERADLCLTDPPYGVKMDKGFEGFGGFGTPIARRQYADNWDNDRPDKIAFELMQSTSKLCIVFGGNFFADILPRSTHWIVWDKLNTMPTFGDCELAWTNSDRKSVKKYTVEYNGLIGKEKERFHPTQKPLNLFVSILKDYSADNQSVYEPLSGSGTTIIACENLGRKCRAIEISPAYVAVALERWATHTGKTPIRLSP